MTVQMLRNLGFATLLAAVSPWAAAYGGDDFPSVAGFSHSSTSQGTGFATALGPDSTPSNFQLTGYAPCVPEQRACPPGTGSAGAGMPGSTPGSPNDLSSAPSNQSLFTNEQIGATGGGPVAVSPGAYIDSAIIGNMVRFRADAAFDDEAPDRAEFIYAKCGCFGVGALGPGTLPEQKINYQELSTYVEMSASDSFSAFVELPVRIIQFQTNSTDDNGGIGDVNFGFKYALIHEADRYLTSQMRFYVPSGDSYLGLGTGHVSVEPAVLYFRRLTDRLSIQGELRDWIPVGGSNFAGNVIRYGFGAGYDLIAPCGSECGRRLTAVTEVVGWDVLNGHVLDLASAGATGDASDTSIINLKVGARLSWDQNSIYAGWGHCLTEQAWYRDIARFEFIHTF
jgi:hypothetical protein